MEKLQLLQGLLTPLIAAIAVYIAWQQWKTNERKTVLDRYDRRLRVYQRVIEFVSLVLIDFKPQPREIARFRAEVAEADFLFGPEIPAYIQELSTQALQSWRALTDYEKLTNSPLQGHDHQPLADEMHNRETWLTQQHAAALQKFKKYLDVSR